MNLDKYKSDYLDSRMQLVLFQRADGQIIYSSDTLVPITALTSAYHAHPFIESLESTIQELQPGQDMFFSCINFQRGEESLYHDYKIEVPSDKDSDMVVWQLFDFTDHYKSLIHVQQQRNETAIVYEYQSLEQEKIRLEKELLEYKNNELSRLQEAKTNFFAQVSHEIRNPVNGILGLTALIKENPKKEHIDALDNLSKHLMSLVNNVLDQSKIESGELTIEQTDFNLYEVIDSIKYGYISKIMDKRLQFLVHIEPTVPQFVKGDVQKLTQILYNLVGNALKFTSKGGVTLHVSMINYEEEEFYLAFKVTDSGIGIAEDKLDDIFEPYKQAEKNTTRMYGGTGLGLPIVKELVELMGGEVFVESEYRMGTTFRFYVPFSHGEVVTESVDKQLIATQSKILLIEDDMINQRVISSFLTAAGHDLEVASSGSEVLRNTTKFDLILMDFNLPDMTAVELLEKLDSHTPVVILSGESEEKLRKELNAERVKRIMKKPVMPDELVKHVNEVLQIDNSTEGNPDASMLEKVMQGDKERISEIIDIFILETPENLKNLNEFYHSQNWHGLRQLLHKVKSAYRYVGLDNISDSLDKLELEIDENGMLKDKEKLINIENQTHKAIEKLKAL